jgi:ribosome assembly protein YihI (activator of Der GTPase)
MNAIQRALFCGLAAIAGCASPPTKCVTAHSPGLQVQSTDPRIGSITIVPVVTTVCVTPSHVEVSDAPK